MIKTFKMASYLEQPELHTKAPFRSALLTYPGNLQEALRQAQADPKKTLFGVAQGVPSVFLTKVYASTKPDWIFLDVEHGMFDRLTLHDAIHAAQFHSEGKTMVIVRVPKHDEISLTTALDAGAAGIIIPHSESAKEVQDIIKTIRYPPHGHRSFSPWIFTPGISDASLYPNDQFNIATAQRHVAIIPQIESVKGVEAADEIAALEGVSGLMFGPGDFMLDAGLPVQLGGVPHPDFLAAMGKFGAAGAKHNKPLLAGALSIDQIPFMISQGFRAIAVTFDVWGIAGFVDGKLKEARAHAMAAGEGEGEVVVANGHSTTNGKA